MVNNGLRFRLEAGVPALWQTTRLSGRQVNVFKVALRRDLKLTLTTQLQYILSYLPRGAV